MLRQVIEQRGRLFEKKRQIIFDSGGNIALADFLVKPAACGIALEFFPESGAESAAPVIVEWKFPRGSSRISLTG